MSFDLKTAFLAILIFAASGASQWALADDSQPTIHQRSWGIEYDYGTKYNPETKSYFSLRHFVRSNGADVGGTGWIDSERVAEESTFHGVHGHLAYVRTPETHEFLLRNFGKKVSYAWIGLRHFCNGGTNVWADGTELKPGEFTAWHPVPWLPRYATCKGGLAVAGVFYTSFDNLFRWQAAPEIHYLRQYFVEFPTGKP